MLSQLYTACLSHHCAAVVLAPVEPYVPQPTLLLCEVLQHAVSYVYTSSKCFLNCPSRRTTNRRRGQVRHLRKRGTTSRERCHNHQTNVGCRVWQYVLMSLLTVFTTCRYPFPRSRSLSRAPSLSLFSAVCASISLWHTQPLSSENRGIIMYKVVVAF